MKFKSPRLKTKEGHIMMSQNIMTCHRWSKYHWTSPTKATY